MAGVRWGLQLSGGIAFDDVPVDEDMAAAGERVVDAALEGNDPGVADFAEGGAVGRELGQAGWGGNSVISGNGQVAGDADPFFFQPQNELMGLVIRGTDEAGHAGFHLPDDPFGSLIRVPGNSFGNIENVIGVKGEFKPVEVLHVGPEALFDPRGVQVFVFPTEKAKAAMAGVKEVAHHHGDAPALVRVDAIDG